MLDLEMPVMNGIDTASEIVKKFPKVKIIVVSMHEETATVLELLKIGVSGYVPKNCDLDILITAIEKVNAGEKYVSERVAENIRDFYYDECQMEVKALNETEKCILQLMAFGKRDKDLTGYLNISINTLKFHKENIRNKTGIETPAQFGAYAVKHKLVDLNDFRLK